MKTAKQTYTINSVDDTPKPGSMSFVRQQSAKGLGHAIWCAREIIGSEPFAILLPDVLIKSKKSCLSQMIDAYEKVGSNMSLQSTRFPMTKFQNTGS